ncbi:MAG: hypothetical protein ACE5GB_08715 [Acidimicrobiales bacterium]
MIPEPEARTLFRRWLIDHDLQPEVAHAILGSMSPPDWSQVARRDEVDARFDQVDARFEQIDARFEQIDARLDLIDGRFGLMEGRIGRLENRVEQLDTRYGELSTRLDGLNRTFVVVGLTLSVTMVLGFATTIASVFLAAA